MRTDLHIHTTASDGSWTPAELMVQIEKAGIRLFAVTDHDSVANIPASRQLARAAGLAFLTGVEISATHRDRLFHILGYGIDPDNAMLKNILRHNTRLMEEVDQDSVRKLIADGLAIDYAEYCAYRHHPARGGWKSLNFLIDKGLCNDVGDFFANLFTPQRGIRFPDFPPPAAVIAAVRAAGGIAVLAHPGSDFHGTELEATLEDFAGEDVGGIECFHPSHSAETTRQAVAWCRRKGLLITGGSDCHGNFVPKRRLGIPPVDLDQLILGDLLKKAFSPVG